MDFLSRMNQAVDYIEAMLDGDIDPSKLASVVCCDVYQFGRIFAYVVGTSLTEYIRSRRLSAAALELQGGNAKVIDIALKYGYTSPDSFTRAFVEVHGVTPREARTPGVRLRLHPRITFHISIKGDVDMEYRIEKMSKIACVGVEKIFSKFNLNSEADNWKEKMGERWDFWEHYLSDDGANPIIRDKYKLYRPPFQQIGATITLPNGDILEQIGAEARPDEEYPELTSFEIPAHTWAVFTARGSLGQKIHPVDQTMTRVMSEWLPASGYELIAGLELQVFGPGDAGADDYTCELWLPVKKK